MHVMLHKDYRRYQRTCIKNIIFYLNEYKYASHIDNDRQQKVGCTKNQGMNE